MPPEPRRDIARSGSTWPREQPASRRTKARGGLAALVLALCAALLSPVSAAGADAETAASAPGKPGGMSGSWGTGANATTLTVTWTKPGGTYLEYDLFYRTDSGTVYGEPPSQTIWLLGPYGFRVESAKLSGLDNTKTYVVAVRARDRETGLYGKWATTGLIEPPGTPGRVSNLHESSRAASSLSLEWSKASDATGGYEVRVSQDSLVKSWATVKTVAQPSSGSTVSAQLASANLPTSFAITKTYVAQVRSKSAVGTCGTGSVKCGRWVQSGKLAQLDITGHDVTWVTPASVPAYVGLLAYDMRVSWDELPAEVSDPTYQVRFYYRSGRPADHYITTDNNSTLHAIPDSWYQDWEWYSLCNDGDSTNDPARGCAKPCSDTWSFINCSRATPYPKPQWYFNGGAGGTWSDWVNVSSATGCETTTAGDRTCSHTFPLAAGDVSGLTVKSRVRAFTDSVKGPVSEWTNAAVRVPTPPVGVRVCGPSGASVRVEWQAGFHNGAEITGYDIALLKAASGQNPSSTTNVSATTGTVASATDARRCDQSSGSTLYDNPSHPVLYYMFHAVDTNRTYSAGVSAINSAGTGSALWSSTVGLTPTAPPAPAPPSVAVTASSATLTWETPADDGGSAVTSYGVRYRKQNADDTWPSDWTTHTRTGTGTSVTETIGSLSAATTYQFQVQACNATGSGGATACGPWSASAAVTTSSS